MKKIIFASAIVLASILSSCGDTSYCYELTATITIDGVKTSSSTYIWATSNELDAEIAKTKQEYAPILSEMGLPQNALKLTYKRTNKGANDCYDY